MEQLDLFGTPYLLELHRPVLGGPAPTVLDSIRFTAPTEAAARDRIAHEYHGAAIVVNGELRHGQVGACINLLTRRRLDLSTMVPLGSAD